MNGWTGREWERKRGNCKEKEILNGEERRKWKMAERDGREWEWNQTGNENERWLMKDTNLD